MTIAFAPPVQPDPLGATLTSVIRAAAADAPRSRQVSIGPSEMGDACARRLAYKLLDIKPCNTSGDPLPSIIGTATHAWLAEAFRADNANYAVPRWLVECRVFPDDAHPGSSDLYDSHTGMVLDWKVVGTTSLRRMKAEGPSRRYIVQGSLYGLGYERLGLAVSTVAIVALPRGGMLTGLHTWTAPYDRQVALDALKRIGDISCALFDLNPIAFPERWGLIPAAPSRECRFCPMWRPGPAADAAGCPGELSRGKGTWLGVARLGRARPGVARHGWNGWARLGMAGFGVARQERHGWVWHGWAWRGEAWQGRYGMAGLGPAWLGWARHGSARQERHGGAWSGSVWLGRYGGAWQGWVRLGAAWQERPGAARFGRARYGKAWLGAVSNSLSTNDSGGNREHSSSTVG